MYCGFLGSHFISDTESKSAFILPLSIPWSRLNLLTSIDFKLLQPPATQQFPKESPSPPCEQVIEKAEQTNIQNGHGNYGWLSKIGAFSSLKQTLSLPPLHAEWDKLAVDLPRLVQTQTVRETIRKMPLLDASIDSLPDMYLQRACSILGMAAHVFVRLEGGEPLTRKYASHNDILPPSLAIPWNIVCERLGRAVASLTYVDGVSANFTSTSPSYSDVTVENMELLVPSVNTIEERTFIGIMIETEAKTIPVLHHVIEAQRAVLAQDGPSLKKAIQNILQLLKSVSKTFGRLHANRSRKSHIDTVLWTLSVANLGIPWIKDAVGVAGTAHPFFYMMDEFSGRVSYESRVGKEAQHVRALHPLHWRQFFEALAEVSVQDYVAASNDRELVDLWESLTSAYHGKDGLLAFHRRKVFGFLSVSFRIGRNTTLGGIGGKRRAGPWHDVDQVLEQGRQERDKSSIDEAISTIEPVEEKVFISQLIEHNSKAAGYWFAAQGNVYDATSFMNNHPGGDTIIKLCSGQDVTDSLKALGHFSIPSIRSKLESFRIATLAKPVFPSSECEELYMAAVDLGQNATELENIHRRNFQLLDGRLTVLDEPEVLTPKKARHLLEAKVRFQDNELPALTTLLDSLIKGLVTLDKNLDISPIRAQITKILASDGSNRPENPYQDYHAAVQALKDESGRLTKIKKHVAMVLEVLERSDFQKSSDNGQLTSLLSSLGKVASEMIMLAGN